MALFNSFTFDNENSLDHGIYITGQAVYNAPERAVDMISIPGKNGAIALDQGRFENIEVTYPAGAFGASQEEFAAKIRAFRNILASRYSYVKLFDTYHPDEYRLGLYKSGLEVSPAAISKAGEFEITFDCKPQRFLLSGEDPIGAYELLPLTDNHKEPIVTETDEIIEVKSARKKIQNPTMFDSKPLIKVIGYGTFAIGDSTITITGVANQVIFIDCESMEIYKKVGGVITPASSLVSMSGANFPVLPPGESGLSRSSTIQDFSIIPRWWII